MTNDFIYDIETYPNIFTLAVEQADAPFKWAFEISQWRNDSKEIIELLTYLRDNNARMVGFNNLGFDYPVVHMLLKMGHATADILYQKAMSIIQSQDSDKFTHMVYQSDRFVEQVDLFKIHHFDNKARSTSLKVLEFNMRSDTVEDLPIKVGTNVKESERDMLKQYNAHDARQTKKFYHHTLKMIEFREALVKLYHGRDWINFNDTKIGKEFFVLKLEEAGVPCYDYGTMGRTPRQTKRPTIALKDAILPSIQFEQPEFTRILNWLKSQVITETRGVFEDVTCTVNGFTFVFGLGGVHGSVENTTVESDDEFVIVDLDVASFYPNLAIVNNFYPQHLGEEFGRIYKNLYEQRKAYPKGSAENAMLKLALNGVYGDSNNPFSVFYDPLFTMSITLNGQLLLCKLAEFTIEWTHAELIQMNTDGMTIRLPQCEMDSLNTVIHEWESMTGLQLEQVEYSRMIIRDVNSYIGVYTNGKVKRKGAYEHDLEWHQNHSALVVPKVAEQVLVHGAPIRSSVEAHPDIMDFMLRAKVPRSGRLTIEKDGEHQQIQNITRYYVAKGGGHLFKWLPPLKGKTEWRKFAIESGWGVQVCNDISDAGELPVDFDYYVNEIEKLTLGMT